MSIQPSTTFLKWAGGKRTILDQIHSLIPEYPGTFIEPFLGGGSVLFSMEPTQKKIVSDSNSELINTYITVRDHPEELLSELTQFKNTSEDFYEIRSWDRNTDFKKRPSTTRAARFIYLNKTCFNGLHRVNSKGHFNVPFGSYKNPDFLNEQSIWGAHEFLSTKNNNEFSTQILNMDYLKVLQMAKQGDFVYLDPPYYPISLTEAFVSYTADGFSHDNQLDLLNALVGLKQKNVSFLMSNSDVEFIHKNYGQHPEITFNIKRDIQVRRSLGASAKSRKTVPEVLIY